MIEKIDYLGDGVYIKITDWGDIILMANHHIYPTDKITLEPKVLESLINFLIVNEMMPKIN